MRRARHGGRDVRACASACADLAREAASPDHALPSRRRRRPGGAAACGQAQPGSGPDGGGRLQAGRKHDHWHRDHREGCTGRLHDWLHHRLAFDQPGVSQEPSLRFAQRLCADHYAGHGADGAGHAPDGAGEDVAGAGRSRESESRQACLRIARLRRAALPRDGMVQASRGA